VGDDDFPKNEIGFAAAQQLALLQYYSGYNLVFLGAALSCN